MSEEKITGLEFLKDIPKTNDLVSAYGSVNLEQLNNVMKRLKKIPNYDELLKENNNLQQENKQLKAELELYKDNHEYLNNKIDKAIEYIKHSQSYGTMAQVMPHLKPYVNGDDLLEILGDKE